MFLKWVQCVISRCFIFSLLLPQCHGKPFSPQSQPTAGWRSPVQLPNHMAGVRRGSGILEGFALDLCHCFAVSWHCLLCEWGATLRRKPAWTGALKELLEDEADVCVLASNVSQFLKIVFLVQSSESCTFFFFCIFMYCNPFRTTCSFELTTYCIQVYCILKLPLIQPDFLGNLCFIKHRFDKNMEMTEKWKIKEETSPCCRNVP